MRIFFTGRYGMNPRELLRRCGYGEVVKTFKHLSTQAPEHPSTGKPVSLRDKLQGSGVEVSYIRRLANAEFPRWHAYLEIKPDGFQVNLHLDQKAPTYGEGTAHSGEYEGEIVEAEGRRIQQTIEKMK
ncbi:MAG: hypothetical protein AAB408_03490 [Patescibacteria group bacterium]